MRKPLHPPAATLSSASIYTSGAGIVSGVKQCDTNPPPVRAWNLTSFPPIGLRLINSPRVNRQSRRRTDDSQMVMWPVDAIPLHPKRRDGVFSLRPRTMVRLCPFPPLGGLMSVTLPFILNLIPKICPWDLSRESKLNSPVAPCTGLWFFSLFMLASFYSGFSSMNFSPAGIF